MIILSSNFLTSSVIINKKGVNEIRFKPHFQFSSVQFTQSCPTLYDPTTAAQQASLSMANSPSLIKLMYTESVMSFNHLILFHPLLLPLLIFINIRVFSSESVLCSRWPKYWSFRFSISPAKEYSVLIYFRID